MSSWVKIYRGNRDVSSLHLKIGRVSRGFVSDCRNRKAVVVMFRFVLKF